MIRLGKFAALDYVDGDIIIQGQYEQAGQFQVLGQVRGEAKQMLTKLAESTGTPVDNVLIPLVLNALEQWAKSKANDPAVSVQQAPQA